MSVELVALAFSVLTIAAGTLFFIAGTTGMLRFPDVYTRLHAMTKADNLGMGFITVGLVVLAPSMSVVFKLILTWGFILMAGTTSAHLVARAARREGVEAKGRS